VGITKQYERTLVEVCNARHGKRCKVKYQQACFGIATYQSHVSILGTVGYGPNMLPVRHSDGQESVDESSSCPEEAVMSDS
jgi:hypothetical protein